jgi:DNA-binding IclR family transcriptional regulator
MAGLGVPIFNHDQRPVAAISIGTTTDRLSPERRDAVAAMLIREAAQISSRIHPFDPTLRRAAAAMS